MISGKARGNMGSVGLLSSQSANLANQIAESFGAEGVIRRRPTYLVNPDLAVIA